MCWTHYVKHNRMLNYPTITVRIIGLNVCYFSLLQVIDKSFGFDSAVEEAQRAINAAHVEAESIENGIGVVKLMGRYSGKFSVCRC
jgi:6-phosphofructokinase 1